MTRLLLIDADILCWRAASSTPDPDAAARRLDDALAALKTRLDGDRLILALSDRGNWRRALLPDYKAARRRRKRPAALEGLRAHLRARYDVRDARDLEADDVLGLLSTGVRIGDPPPQGAERVVVSADKDLKTVPGLLARGLSGVMRITPAQAARAHLRQTLIGDGVDGYRGCPGVGEKTAAAFLRAPYRLQEDGGRWRRAPTSDLWGGIVSLFARAGLSAADALVQARVARILRAGDYDPDSGAVRYWRPDADLSVLEAARGGVHG